MATDTYQPFDMKETIRQSPPIDLTTPYEDAWLKGKTILITGGASGFGAAFVRRWAKAGAVIIIGDINVEAGDKLAREVRTETSNPHIYFEHCDVTDWQAQVDLFKAAVKHSPHGGIDVVVPNAGIARSDPFTIPKDPTGPAPQKPNLKVYDINMTGVMYTTHLAFWYLPRNPGSKPAGPDTDPTSPRDRHIMFVGSIASLFGVPGQPQYSVAKHGVIGLFRSLRAQSFFDGIRCTALLPYFMDTPIVPAGGRLLLAGGTLGDPEDVIEAGTRLAADPRIVGRALLVGPRIKVKQEEDGTWAMVPRNSNEGEVRTIWEAYADDWEDTERFCRSMIKVFNAAEKARGWYGWVSDILGALWYGWRNRR